MNDDLKALNPDMTEEEFQNVKRSIELENQDKKEDAQRRMAWVAMISMILYPVFILIAAGLGLTSAMTVLGSMAPTFFVSVAAIVMAFYGAQAYKHVQAKK